MRKFAIAAAALIAAAPAAAQPAYEDEWVEDAPPAIDARDVGRMAQAMDRLVGAVMDLPVGGIVQAVDPLGRSGYHPGTTVRDMAERDDPYAEERIRAGIRGATRGITVMQRSFAQMMPVLQRSLDEIGRNVAEALEEVDRGADY